jgi:hypothetical protein
MQAMDQLEQQARVLNPNVLDAQSTPVSRQADSVPGNKAATSFGVVVTCPEESPASFVKSGDDTREERHRTHDVG